MKVNGIPTKITIVPTSLNPGVETQRTAKTLEALIDTMKLDVCISEEEIKSYLNTPLERSPPMP